jgi:atypical dual specificity phosphatase
MSEVIFIEEKQPDVSSKKSERKPVRGDRSKDEEKEKKNFIKWKNHDLSKYELVSPNQRTLDSPDVISIDGRIFLGSYENGAKNLIGLKSLGITHVLTVGVDMPIPHADENFKYKLIKVYDSQTEDLAKYFEECFQFINTALNEKPSNKVLIHCWAGISRSATITLFAMAQRYHISYICAYEMVRRLRWWIRPNPGFQQQLIDFLKTKNKLEDNPKQVECYTECANTLRKMYKTKSITQKQREKVTFSFSAIFGKNHPYSMDVIDEMRSFVVSG